MSDAGGDLCGSVLAEILLAVVFLPELLAVLGIGSGVSAIVLRVSAILRSGVLLGGILFLPEPLAVLGIGSGVSAIVLCVSAILRGGAV